MSNTTVDISALDAYGKQHKAEILGVATMPDEVTSHMTLIPGIKDKYEVNTLTFSKLVKPYVKDWSPSQKGGIEPRVLRVEVGQVELEEEPNQYRKTWMGQLMQQGVNESDHPFEAAFNMEIAKKVKEDIALDLVWRGIRNASGTTPSDLNNGFFKLIDDAIAASTLTVANGHVIETGALTEANIIDKLRLMWKSLPAAYRRQPVKMFLSHTNYYKYIEAYQAEHGALPYNTSVNKQYLDVSGNMCELVPQAGFGETDRIVVGPQSNFLYGVDLVSDQENITVFNPGNPKTVGYYLSFAIGFQFATENAIWVNDQTESSSSSSASA